MLICFLFFTLLLKCSFSFLSFRLISSLSGAHPWPSRCPSPSSRPPSRYQSGPTNSLPPRAATPTRPPSRPPSRPSRPQSHPSAHGSTGPLSTMPKHLSSEGIRNSRPSSHFVVAPLLKFKFCNPNAWIKAATNSCGTFLVFNKMTHSSSCSIFYCYPCFYAWLKGIWGTFDSLMFCGVFVSVGVVFCPWGHHWQCPSVSFHVLHWLDVHCVLTHQMRNCPSLFSSNLFQINWLELTFLSINISWIWRKAHDMQRKKYGNNKLRICLHSLLICGYSVHIFA